MSPGQRPTSVASRQANRSSRTIRAAAVLAAPAVHAVDHHVTGGGRAVPQGGDHGVAVAVDREVDEHERRPQCVERGRCVAPVPATATVHPHVGSSAATTFARAVGVDQD